MAPPKAWYKLMKPEYSWDKVPLIKINDVADLKAAIKKAASPVLDTYFTGQLVLKVSKWCKEENQAVEVGADDTLVSILKTYALMDDTLAANSYQVDATLVQKSFAENIRVFVYATSGKHMTHNIID
jgi:hypothetical protein